jgi:hypothetical protein
MRLIYVLHTVGGIVYLDALRRRFTSRAAVLASNPNSPVAGLDELEALYVTR